MPNPSLSRRHKGLVRHTLDQLLLVDAIRYLVVGIRFHWFTKVRRRLLTYDSKTGATGAVATHTIAHNLRGLRDLAVNRSHLLVRPLSVVESLPVDARVLSIGPRTEGELFNLAAHGFDMARIRGLDLISYSPRIQVGDMHQSPFADDSFDAVILGWVLAYSEDPKAAARETVRVLRRGGIVAIGVEYNPKDQSQILLEAGYMPGSARRIASCEEILGFFEGAVEHVYMNHTVAQIDRDAVGSFCVMFSVRK